MLKMIRKNDNDLTEIIINVLRKLNIKVCEKTEKLLIQIFKFIVVGGIATIIDWLVYYVCYNHFGINPLLANILSFVVAVIYNYSASISWVFVVNQGKNKFQLFLEFMLFSIIGLLITELLLWLGINKLNINAMFVKIIATSIVMIFNFVTRKMFLE